MDKFEEKQPSGESKFVRVLSVLAAVMAVAMYVAYIDQIQKTWGDAKGAWIQHFVAGINCSLWVAYGFLKRDRDYPIIFANLPGIILGFLAAYSAAF